MLLLVEVNAEQAQMVEQAMRAVERAMLIVNSLSAGHVPEGAQFSGVRRGAVPEGVGFRPMFHAEGNGKNGPVNMLAFDVPEPPKEG